MCVCVRWRNFQDDCADALLKTSMPVVILSTAALQRMVKLNADSAIDNLLLEWTFIVELLDSKTIKHCLPIIIGTYNLSASSRNHVACRLPQAHQILERLRMAASDH